MNHIVLICGRSGSGKTTILNNLRNLVKTEINDDVSIVFPKLYTTRPKRENETDEEYIFVSDEEFESKRNQMMHVSEYDTISGIWKYGVMMDYSSWYGTSTNGFAILPVNLDGYFPMSRWLKEYNRTAKYREQIKMDVIYIYTKPVDVLIRSIKRELEKPKEKQDFAEILRRYQTETDKNYCTPGLKFNAFYCLDSFEYAIGSMLDVEELSGVPIDSSSFASTIRGVMDKHVNMLNFEDKDASKDFHCFHSIDGNQELLSKNVLKSILDLNKPKE